jgi:hypothetical protein
MKIGSVVNCANHIIIMVCSLPKVNCFACHAPFINPLHFKGTSPISWRRGAEICGHFVLEIAMNSSFYNDGGSMVHNENRE